MIFAVDFGSYPKTGLKADVLSFVGRGSLSRGERDPRTINGQEEEVLYVLLRPWMSSFLGRMGWVVCHQTVWKTILLRVDNDAVFRYWSVGIRTN